MKLLKTMVILTLVVGLFLGGVLPAQADNGKPPWAPGRVQVIRGEVIDVDLDEDEIEVAGETIIVDETTKIRVPTLGKESSLDDIESGMQVVVQAYRAEDGLYARYILVIPGRPQYRHHVGTVTAYEEVSITIEDRQGNTIDFVILDELKILPSGASVEVGARVTVISRRDLVGDRLIARGVVVHPERPWLGLGRVSGTIEEIDEPIITIDTTEVEYDDKTIFILRGILAVEEGQEATVIYREQEDSTLLAKLVLVGVDLPGIRTALGKVKP